MKLSFAKVISAGAILVFVCVAVSAQTSAFKFDGKLTDNGPAEGQYDFVFRLFDLETGGTLVATEQIIENVQVSDGQYSVELSFGFDPFTNVAAHWLEVGWRRGVDTGAFATLAPRHHILSAPYAVQSAFASDANAVGGVPASQVVNTSDPRLSDARAPLPNSSDYIQNTTSQQTANFNVSGDGKIGGTISAGVVNARQYLSLDGIRMFSSVGMQNLFAGTSTGGQITTGDSNSFYGHYSGYSNTTGTSNDFFGKYTGFYNTTGIGNAFFGSYSGNGNRTGSQNSFFGSQTGNNNTSGNDNSFFGYASGISSPSGSSRNTIVGAYSNFLSTTGLPIDDATAIGSSAKVSASNSTAIGANALVSASNSIVLGGINGVNGASADTKVGIGTTSPAFKLHVIDSSNTGLRLETNTAGGTVASFGSLGVFQIDAPGVVGGRLIIRENGNTGLGTATPSFKLHVIDPSNSGLRVQTNIAGGKVASYGGLGEFQIDAPGIAGGRLTVAENGNVNIGTWNTPDKLGVNGRISFATLGAAGSTQLCRNAANQISTCSSSLRYNAL